MNIFSTKEEALISLNTTRITAGEIKVYRYYSVTGTEESFVVIGLTDGIGPDCYQILSKRRNLIVCIDTELPDSTKLIQGQVHVCPIDGIYHMIYLEDSVRVNKEIKEGEVYYVEDFDTSYTYYLDRYTCKRLDDYYSKVYISLSNSQAVWSNTSKPETVITVWKDNTNITKQCKFTFKTEGCDVIFDGTKVIRVISVSSQSARVTINAEYRGNIYSETWNIIQPKEGMKGDNAEIYQILTGSSIIRPGDLQTTTLTVLHKDGSETDYWDIEDLPEHGLVLKAFYSDGTDSKISTSQYTFKSGSKDITYVTLKLVSNISEVLSILTIPYLPDTSDITDGQGIYKAIVFKRIKDMTGPEVPVGGTWDNPIPTDTDWSTQVPIGTDPLWTSTRIFTSDGKPPQDDSWSVPSRISNTEYLEIMYSSCDDATIVGTPKTNPENWSKSVTGLAYFMATRTITNGISGLWQVFAIRGKDGVKSNYKNYVYYLSDTKPDTPVGSKPSGWLDYPNTDGTWWMSTATFNGETNELLSSWSNPIKITGTDGQDGEQGPYYIYQYSVGNSPLDAPVSGWSTIIPSLNRGQYLWQRSGKIVPPLTYPTEWGAPIRITGEKGESGSSGISITVDLTNEVSSVPATYDGRVLDGTQFETSTVQVYENSERLDFTDHNKITNVVLTTNGVDATINNAGVISISRWTGANEQEVASVTVTLSVYGTAYTTVYTLNKVRSGAPGEASIVYSIIPGASVLRRSSGKIEPSIMTASVRKSKGNELSEVQPTDLIKTDGLELRYQVNDGPEEPYKGPVKVPEDTDIFTFVLKSLSTGSELDKETIPVVDSAYNLVVDLDNELSAIACDLNTGQPLESASYEESKVSVYYGEMEVPMGAPGLRITDTWLNVTGTFDQETGIIKPNGWDPREYGKDTGSVILSVSYGSYLKKVTYTIKKIAGGVNGESPEIYSITPNVSNIKVNSEGVVNYDSITVEVTKTVGKTSSTLDYSTWVGSGLKMSYQRTVLGTGIEVEKVYTPEGIKVDANVNSITVFFRDSKNNILDMETIPVIRDGEKGVAPDWRDYIFCNSETQPNAPTFTTAPTGTLADQYGKIWVDSPSGTAGSIWWMSTAMINGMSSIDAVIGSWSTPVRVTGDDGTNGDGYECQYCNSQNLNTAPPETDSGWTTSVTTPASGFYTWMRMRVIDGTGKPGAWQYMRITGEAGEDGAGIDIKTNLIYVGDDSSNIDTSAESRFCIIGDTPYQEGDTTYEGLLYHGTVAVAITSVANGECYTYNGSLFICTGHNRGYNSWSISNIKGIPGDSYVVYTAYAPEVDGEADITRASNTWTTGAGWFGTCTVNQTDYPNPPAFSSDMWKWARFLGTDGPGQEFIFYRTGSQDILPPDISGYPAVQEDEFRFGGTDETLIDTYGVWTDNPLGAIDEDGKRVEWTSYRTKHGGVWSQFSKPAVYANSVGIEDVKTYLTDGNAEITGNLYNLPGWYFKKDGSGWVAGKWTDPLGDNTESNITKGIYWDTSGNATFNGTVNAKAGSVGGWNITEGSIQIGTGTPTVYLKSDGSGSLADGNIEWNTNGSGSVANGNISWDESGNVTFGSGVTLSWSQITGDKPSGGGGGSDYGDSDVQSYLENVSDWTTIIGSDYIQSSQIITNELLATSGTIGGWVINSDSLESSNVDSGTSGYSIIKLFPGYNPDIYLKKANTNAYDSYYTISSTSISPSGISIRRNENAYSIYSDLTLDDAHTQFNSDGSGWLANKKIEWNSNGDATIGGWEINEKSIHRELHIDNEYRYGINIYSGSSEDDSEPFIRVANGSYDDIYLITIDPDVGIVCDRWSSGDNGFSWQDSDGKKEAFDYYCHQLMQSGFPNSSWKLGINGTGHLANGNLSWDKDGNLYGTRFDYQDYGYDEWNKSYYWKITNDGNFILNNEATITLNNNLTAEDPRYTDLSCDGIKIVGSQDDTVEITDTYIKFNGSTGINITSSGITLNGVDIINRDFIGTEAEWNSLEEDEKNMYLKAYII